MTSVPSGENEREQSQCSQRKVSETLEGGFVDAGAALHEVLADSRGVREKCGSVITVIPLSQEPRQNSESISHTDRRGRVRLIKMSIIHQTGTSTRLQLVSSLPASILSREYIHPWTAGNTMHPALQIKNIKQLPPSIRDIVSKVAKPSRTSAEVSAARQILLDVPSLTPSQRLAFLPVFFANLDPDKVPGSEQLDDANLRPAIRKEDVGPSLWPRVWAWFNFVHVLGHREILLLLGICMPSEHEFCVDFISFVNVITSHLPTRTLIATTPGFRACLVKGWECLPAIDNPSKRTIFLYTISLFLGRVTTPSQFEEMLEAAGSVDHIAFLVLLFLRTAVTGPLIEPSQPATYMHNVLAFVHLFHILTNHKTFFSDSSIIMPAFTKTVSGLTKPILIMAANAFQLEATGSATELRARVKAYMETNKAAIMANPHHAPLSSRKEREDWANREPSLAPSSWHGILGSAQGSTFGDGDENSVLSDVFLGPIPGSGTPTPQPTANGLTEHDIRLQHLQNLEPAELEKVFAMVYAPGLSNPVHALYPVLARFDFFYKPVSTRHHSDSYSYPGNPNTPAHATTSSVPTGGRTRPDRQPGLIASNASFIIPEAIRKKFSSGGWSVHVPLDYLTDKFCGASNAGATKALNDLWTMDGSSGSIVSVAKELPIEAELKLSFDEWFQAWQRLLQLIAEYVPREYVLWRVHYESILLRPMRAQQWLLCLAYDSRVRSMAINSEIDPSQFQLAIWNELEPAFIANNAAQFCVPR
ncbi:hypothetical protein FB45DRAFT_1015492 [Roridomyces roridus]|uniref:Uncharacterized protein n=1 Tax=Roridomyces roridus TaxID=1738132 RepID=A0AAD7AWT7_9AGAR|nr:hypothetical protein FB45DRAFT_1015492 [Roridomyces roridus]